MRQCLPLEGGDLGRVLPGGVPTSRSLWALYQARFSPPSSVLSPQASPGGWRAGPMPLREGEMVDITRFGPAWGRGPGSFWTQSPGGGRVTGEGAPGGRRRLGCWGGHSSLSTDPGEL